MAMRQASLYSPTAFGHGCDGRRQRPARTTRVIDRNPPADMPFDTTECLEIDRLNGLLLRVARERDRQAFVILFQHFAPRVKSFLLRGGVDASAAEEIVQEVMINVWRRADRFDPALAAASTWIFTIARNQRIDRLRREARPEIDPDDPALVPAAAVAADEGMLVEERSQRLRRAIQELPAEQAELLRMAYFEDKAHSAIASEQRLPLGTVKSRLRLALTRLRRAMGADGVEEPA